MSQKFAPFTPEEVTNLNAYQAHAFFHPFTCGNGDCGANLVATVAGWVCPRHGCGCTQNWAHEGMANGSWKKQWDKAFTQAEGEERSGS